MQANTASALHASILSPRTLILALFVLTLAPLQLWGQVYVTQAGGGSGASCASPRAVSSLVSGDWGSDKSVHLCGTITSNITVGASGTSGHVTSLIFETGAKISVGSCGTTGCVNISGKSYVVVDGGSNGIIEATNSGTGLGTADSVAVYARSGTSNAEIKNLTINNMYVHSSASDNAANNWFGVWLDGSNNLIHDNTVKDAYAGIKVEITSSGNQYYNNIIHNINWGIFESGSGLNSITNEKIYGNEIYDFANWDTTADTDHHDGIFLSGNASTTDVTHVDVYNNYLHGTTSDPTVCAGSPGNGSCMTAHIYINTDSNVRVFNNLIVMNAGDPGPNNGEILMFVDANDSLYNNTLIGGGNSANNSNCMVLNSGTGFVVENNIMSNCPNLLWNNGSTITTLNNNVYQDSSLSWRSGSSFYSSLAAWKTATGKESSSLATTGSLNLNTSYVPQTGSLAIGAGANLTSLGITALDSDKADNARPSSGAWDSGALNSAGGTPSVAMPTFSPTPGAYGSPQTVTIATTTAGATLCYTTDGSNPTTNGAGTCTHGTTYSAPFSVSVTTSLKAIGTLAGYTDSSIAGATYTINGAASVPTFSPVAGSYGPTQSVTISSATAGATICYTNDGSTPTADGAGTCTHGSTYSTAVSVSTSQTLKAIASKSTWLDSSVSSAAYVINGAASTPTFSPAAGTYGPAQSVTITSATSGTTICYTTNGVTPSSASAGVCAVGSTQYVSPVTVSTSLTVKAIATKAGWSDSSVGSAAYVINGTVSTPTFSPASLSSAGWITIATTTPGASCFYTTDGTTPTTSSTAYTHSIYVAQAQTLKAICSAPSHTNSAVGTQAYSFTAPQTAFYISANGSTDIPSPFPHVSRIIGAQWRDLLTNQATDCSTFDFTLLDNWTSLATSHGAVSLYTFDHVPTCANSLNTVSPVVYSYPPTDISAGNLMFKDFVDALMNHECGVTGYPVSPLSYISCGHIQYYEGWNEANVGKYWSGTDAENAIMQSTAFTEIRKYCSDCILLMGSTSAGGKGNEYYYTSALAIAQALTATPDAASFHPYPSRTNVKPVPFPTTIVSNSDSKCSTTTPSVYCDIAVKDEVSYFQTHVLSDSSVKSWAANLPVYLTEGAYGINDGVCDGADCDETHTNVANLRGWYAAEWMAVLAAQNPAWSMWYVDKDQCWGTVTWNGTSPGSSCPNTPPATIGTSFTQTAINQMNTWLGAHTISGVLTSATVTGGNKWSIQLDGGAAELDFCDAWLASCTATTSFNSATDLSGNTNSLSGSVTLNQGPMLLFSTGVVATPTFSPSAGSYTTSQTVTISDSTAGATICYTTDGTTPTSGPVGTCSNGTTYTAPIAIGVTTVLKAIGTKSAMSDSTVASGTYTITLPTVTVTLTGSQTWSGTAQIH